MKLVRKTASHAKKSNIIIRYNGKDLRTELRQTMVIMCVYCCRVL